VAANRPNVIEPPTFGGTVVVAAAAAAVVAPGAVLPELASLPPLSPHALNAKIATTTARLTIFRRWAMCDEPSFWTAK